MMPALLLPDDMARMLANCDREQGLVHGIPAPQFWRAFLLVNLCTGIRVGEMEKLVWHRVDFAKGTLSRTVHPKAYDAIHDLTPEALRALEDIRLPERRIIFESSATNRRIYSNVFKRLQEGGAH